MGELLKILDYLEAKHYAKYCWVYERTRFSPENTWTYVLDLEDSHGYSIAA